MRIYGYLRASTKEQDATRARKSLENFAIKQGFKVSAWFVENVSGASLARPELFRLLDLAENGDGVLIESVDRITRLNQSDWETLRDTLQNKGLRLISLDLPTSHDLTKAGDWLTDSIIENINRMMLDVMAVTARTDYETKRKRQAEGIAKAKEKGRFKGRPVDTEKHKKIRKLLNAGMPWKDIEKLVPCSSWTIAKVKKELEQETK